jgi:hypothetical protein
MKGIYDSNINIHGFGVKVRGLKLYKEYLKSADSLAWVVSARFSTKSDTCTHKYKKCVNCFEFKIRI